MERRLAAVLATDMAGYSRLIERDEAGTLTRQKAHRQVIVDPAIAKNGGRICKTTGDGFLAEFPAAQDAVHCAVDLQHALAERERGQGHQDRIAYRMGINLGDIIFDEGDMFGDGVNVAARLQTLAEPGGLCISDLVHQTVADRADVSFRDMGRQRVKNIARPIRVWQWTLDQPSDETDLGPAALQQSVQFTRARDGTQIAWAGLGSGRPVLKAPNWLNHLEYEWRSPLWGPVLSELARHNHLVRFDQRGNGLSDWEVEDISEAAMIEDMATVADAAGLDRYALFGISQGGAFSIRYAATYPERVSCLVLIGSYLHGPLKRPDPEQRKIYEALAQAIRDGWGSANPIFRSFFVSSFIPDAAPALARSFDELQRISTNPENALRLWEMNAWVEVTELARQIRAPTLVLHCADERVVPIDEGRRIAKHIPGATFVELPGHNHALLAGTPEFEQFFEVVTPFLAAHNS